MIDQIERISARGEVNNNELPDVVFRIDDRIRIINGVRAGQVPTGVVTRVTADRIYITTDDGTHTWRARRNLVRV